jgi:hypothetical protein
MIEGYSILPAGNYSRPRAEINKSVQTDRLRRPLTSIRYGAQHATG